METEGRGIAASDVNKNYRVLPDAQTDKGGKKQMTRQFIAKVDVDAVWERASHIRRL